MDEGAVGSAINQTAQALHLQGSSIMGSSVSKRGERERYAVR